MHLKRGIVSVSKGCNVSSWDGVIHWSPAAQFPGLKTRAVAVVWNPLSTAIEGAEIKLPLYYAGFAGRGASLATATLIGGGLAATPELHVRVRGERCVTSAERAHGRRE